MDFFILEFILIFARAFGFCLLLPGGKGVFSFPTRILLALGLAAAYTTTPEPEATSLQLSAYHLCLTVLTEFLAGLFFCFPLAFAVDIAKQWGELIDRGRGLQLGVAYQGLSDGEDNAPTPFTTLFEYLVITSLYSSGIFLQLIVRLKDRAISETLSASFDYGHLGLQLLECVCVSLLTSFRWFLPLGILFIICDVSIGFVAKLVPGVPVYAESFVVKSILTFLLLLNVYLPQYQAISRHFLSITISRTPAYHQGVVGVRG